MTAQPTERRGEAVFSRAAVVSDTAAEDARSVDVVASTDALDAHGTVIRQNWQLDRYRAYPVVLFAHDQCELPIGLASNIRIEDGSLRATLNFSSGDLNPKAEQVWQNVKAGVLRGVSIGFIPHSIRFETEEDREFLALDDNELLEISIVPVPSNPETLASMRSRALGTAALRSREVECTDPKFAIGDRVESLADHEPGMKGMTGTVAIARPGCPPYYGVKLDDDEGEIHMWLAEDELKRTDKPAPSAVTNEGDSSPMRAAAALNQPAPSAQGNQMSEPVLTPTIVRALGLPVGSTENDAISCATRQHELEVGVVAILSLQSSAEALGAIRGLKAKADKFDEMSSKLAQIEGERDQQNFEVQIQRAVNERKMSKASIDQERKDFAEALAEGRGTRAVARLKGFLDTAPVLHAERHVQPKNSARVDDIPLDWNGVSYRDLKPAKRAQLSRENPDLYRLMKSEWEAAGRPAPTAQPAA